MKKTVLVDDLDGTEAEETVTFGLDGDHYEIDLSRRNADELRTVFARYATVARPTRSRNGKPKNAVPASSTKTARRPVKRRSKNGVPAPSEVRAWAKESGIDVNPTGRVPKSLIADYLAAKGSK